MYNSNRSKRLDFKSLDDLLNRTTEYDIYARYIGQFKIGTVYNSPIRKDKNPSFGIFYSKRHNKLFYKDFATGDSGDVIKFVSMITGVTGYIPTIQKIVSDLGITNKTKLITTRPLYHSTETNIDIVRQPFTKSDIEYWKKFGIQKKTLEKFKVFSIQYYLCNGIVRGKYHLVNPMYAYQVADRYKIYRPFASKYVKWRNNLTMDDIQGYEQLPETGDLLIITKSLKDVMVLYEMGYNAISPSSESSFITEKMLSVLKKRFKTLLICFDRDAPGIRSMRKLKKLHELDGFLVHKKFNSKDISDAVEASDFKTVKNWIKKALKL